MNKLRRRYALLDRDGTIIVDKVYLSDPKKIEFMPNAIEGLQRLRDAGFGLIIITNQSAIARGLLDTVQLDRIHARLLELLAEQGIKIDAVYFCPHGPKDNCYCRKPRPGMIAEAMKDFMIDPRDAIFIGDAETDMQAARAAGIQGIKISDEKETLASYNPSSLNLLSASILAMNM